MFNNDNLTNSRIKQQGLPIIAQYVLLSKYIKLSFQIKSDWISLADQTVIHPVADQKDQLTLIYYLERTIFVT